MGGIDYSLVINDAKNYTMDMGIVLSQGSIGHMIGSGSPSVELMVKLHDVYGDNATPQVREWVKSEIEDDGPKWREKFIIPGLMISRFNDLFYFIISQLNFSFFYNQSFRK